MTHSDITHQRLHNQHIAEAAHEKPEDEVRWLGAVQAQDFLGAKWALGLRLKNAVDADVERAFTDGSILRTHVMRPTWHFVAREDIRWLLDLTAPRVNAASAYQYRRYELDRTVFKRTHAVLEKELRGGRQRTREELGRALQKAGVAADNLLRLAHIVMRAELDGVICSGARRGKQFTYALLDERAPDARALPRDEALAELAGRFFTSRGPATVHDFAKWSGLTVADAGAGLEAVRSRLEQDVIDGRTYWFAAPAGKRKASSPTAYLLPNFDEYTIAYKDHSAVCDPSLDKWLVYNYTIIIDGRLAGNWKRTLKKSEVIIETHPFAPLKREERDAVAAVAERYGKFLDLSVVGE